MIAERINRIIERYERVVPTAERDGRALDLLHDFLDDLGREFASDAWLLLHTAADEMITAKTDREHADRQIREMRAGAGPKFAGLVEGFLEQGVRDRTNHPDREVIAPLFKVEGRRAFAERAARTFERRLDELLRTAQDGGQA